MDVLTARGQAQDIVLLFAAILEQLHALDGDSKKDRAKTKLATELTCAVISNPNYGGIKTCALDRINQELLEQEPPIWKSQAEE